MESTRSEHMSARWKDRLIDRVSIRSDRLIGGAYARARRCAPHEPLHHGVRVVRFLSERLALAEICLRNGRSYSEYRLLLREI
jgi:hypothetical protein